MKNRITALVSVLAIAVMLGGCASAETIRFYDNDLARRLNALEGKPITNVILHLGRPREVVTTNQGKVYTWGYILRENCKIRFQTDNNDIILDTFLEEIGICTLRKDLPPAPSG